MASGPGRRTIATVSAVADVDEAEFSRWRAQAGRTLDTAKLAADGDRPEWACFLAEQAAQLAVKGLLHGVGAEAWGHDLTVLERRATTLLGDAWPAVTADEAARLSRHYIASRYPDAHPSGPPAGHYRPVDASQALEDGHALVAAVDGAWATLLGGFSDPEESA